MLVRGVVVSYETVRRWCHMFGQAYASRLKYQQPKAYPPLQLQTNYATIVFK